MEGCICSFVSESKITDPYGRKPCLIWKRWVADWKECLLKYKNSEYLPDISINEKMTAEKIMSSVQYGWRCNLSEMLSEYSIRMQKFLYGLLNRTTSQEPNLQCLDLNMSVMEWGMITAFPPQSWKLWRCIFIGLPKIKSLLFLREVIRNFPFTSNNEKKMKKMIRRVVAANQLFFAVSCTMNYGSCIEAMK